MSSSDAVRSKRKRKTPAGVKREQDRLRSQKCRMKKKEYWDSLENEVEELKNQIADLSRELEHYKAIFKINGIDINKETLKLKFLDAENFHFNDMTNMIKEHPEMVKSTLHYQLWENDGPTSESRVKLIKNAFRSLIDFAVPDGIKIAWISYVNLHRDHSSPNSAETEKEDIMSLYEKYKALHNIDKQEFINSHKLSMFHQILFEDENAKELIEIEADTRHIVREFYDDIKDVVITMVRAKRRLMKHLDRINKFALDAIGLVSIDQINKLILIFKKLRKPELLNRYNLWGIPKKTEIHEDVYLSESE